MKRMIDLSRFTRPAVPEDSERAAGLTHVGKVRQNNEDYYLVEPEKQLYIVCDGMGGHNAGEVASQKGAQTLNACLHQELISQAASDPSQVKALLERSIQMAHEHILDQADTQQNYSNMGSTLVMGLFLEDMLYVAHVGDSRAYLLRDKHLELLTNDHSYVMELVREGKMKREDIPFSPIKNHLLQALGAIPAITPDIASLPVRPEDLLLLCTDGLWDCVPEEDICRLMLSHASCSDRCQALVDAANQQGGHDNITVVVARPRPQQTVSRPRVGQYSKIFHYPGQDGGGHE